MKKLLAAIIAVASCTSVAQAQQELVSANASAPILTLEQAVAAAGGAAPSADAAEAGIKAARANRTVTGLRPNAVTQAQIENVVSTGPYSGLRSAETTTGVALPIELGGIEHCTIQTEPDAVSSQDNDHLHRSRSPLLP